jgi:hypothetical protein
MQRNTKIILSVIVGVFLLTMLTIGGVVWYVARNADGWLERGETLIAEGREAGQSLDSVGCVDRAIADYRKDRGTFSALGRRFWLNGCLETAERNTAICPTINGEGTIDQVREIMGASSAFCEKHGLGADQNCQQFAEEVMDFCFKPGQG